MRAFALAALLLSGCGALVDERYRGPLQLMLAGEVIGDPAPLEEAARAQRLRAALFYFPNGLRNAQTIDDLVEAESTAVVLRPPASVEMRIYDLPEARHLARTASGKAWAVGVPFVYVDDDDSGRYEPGERVVGEAPISGVYFSEEALTRDESPSGLELDTGGKLRLGGRPTACHARPPEPTERTDCGVPLGAACTSDAECGAGVCLKTEPWPWPNGTCALPDSATCAPEGGHVWRNHRDPTQRFWLKACERDADCRGEPYRCDVANAVCLPINNMYLRIDLPMRLPMCVP